VAGAWDASWAISLTALALMIVRVAVIEPRPTIFARSRFDGATVAGVARPLDVSFDDQLILLGFDPAQLSLPADGALSVSLYWRAQTTPAADYATTVQVWDEAGNLWAQSDSQHPGRMPTSRWASGQYARDEHRLTLPLGTPPGDYRLRVGVYLPDGPALSVLDVEHVPQGQRYVLGALGVTPARRPQAWPAGDAAPARFDLGPVTLLEAVPSAATLPAGEALVLNLLWTSAEAQRPDLRLRWELVTNDGQVIAAQDAAPARVDYPASAWARDELVRAIHRLRVPATAEAGALRVQLSLLTADSGERVAGPVAVASLTVSVPPRTFERPAMSQTVDAAIGEPVTLLGYDLAPAGAGVTLYWRAKALMDRSYSAFVHVLGPEGELLAQADRVPAGGARPTTGWLPGEIVADAYALPLAGAAALRAGLYDPDTLVRLGAVDLPLPPPAP
jgi:hypothetical protein